MCAILVFTCVSNQRSGLWGPSLADCAACNGTTQCTTGQGGPHGLGCGYLAFGQFQCAPAYAPGHARNSLTRRAACRAPARRRLICAVGIMWWIGASVILALAFIGRSPPPMTARAPMPLRRLRCAALPQPGASRAPRCPGALTLRDALRRSS